MEALWGQGGQSVTDDPTTKSIPPGDEGTTLSADPNVGRRIGGFHIKSVIGSGGMGTVYLATQDEPRRDVALKLMKHGIASRSALRRFKFEAQLLARLRHPGIAQIYESGTHDDGSGGVPYFAIEYIPGALPLTTYAKEKKLDIGERLDLFTEVCDAVAHGHQKGIIHRDLKPDNILVDSRGRPRIIDFGVARATDSDLAVTTLQTDLHQIIGTLQYMSPEQCGNDALDIDTSSDVYALGVVLYELLCDQLPYDISSSLLPAAVQIIRTQTPVRPSTVNRAVKGDVQTIVLKALDKERDRRYRTAAELGDDVRRYLDNEPIVARSPSVLYQVRLFARRNKTVFAAMAVTGLVLVSAAAVSTTFAIRVTTARNRTLEQLYIANLSAAERSLQFDATSSAKRRLEQAPEHLRRWEWDYVYNLTDQSVTTVKGRLSPDKTRIASWSGDTVRLLDVFTGEQVAALLHEGGEIDSATFPTTGSFLPVVPGAWQHLHTRSGDTVTCWHVSSDGRRMVSSRQNTLRLWSAPANKIIAILHGVSSPNRRMSIVGASWDDCRSIDLSPDGTRLAVVMMDRTIKILDVATGEELTTLPRDEIKTQVSAVAFSPDGARIVSGSPHRFKFWNAVTGELLSVTPTLDQSISTNALGQTVFSVGFTADSTRLVVRDTDTVRVLDATTGEEVCTIQAYRVSVSPDGTRLATATAVDDPPEEETGRITIWDAESGDKVAVSAVHGGGVRSISFSPDGQRIASISRVDIRILDAITGAEMMNLNGHDLAFSPDGSLIAWWSGDSTISLAAGAQSRRLRGHSGSVRCVSFSANGEYLVSASENKAIKVWNPATGAELVMLRGHDHDVDAVVVSPDGARVTSVSGETIKLWDVRISAEPATFRGHEGGVNFVAFTSDGSRLVSGSSDRTIRIWAVITGNEIVVLHGHKDSINYVGISPDGRLLVTASDDGVIKTWDTEVGRQLSTIRWETTLTLRRFLIASTNEGVLVASWRGSIYDGITGKLLTRHAFPPPVSLSADGRLLAAIASRTSVEVVNDDVSVSTERSLELWDIDQETMIATLDGSEESIEGVVFSMDGAHVATTMADETIQVWDVASGTVIATMLGHEDSVNSVAFNPDGTRLVSGSSDLTIKVWDVATGAELITFGGHNAEVTCVTFSPDGSRLASSSADGVIRLWSSHSFAARHRDRQLALSARASALPTVQERFNELASPREVVEALKNDELLSEAVLQQALNLALRMAVYGGW